MLETSGSELKGSLTLGLPLAIELISYWRDKLAGSIPLLDLPTDRSRQAAPTGGSGVQPIFLTEKLVNSLEIVADDRDVDLFVTLLAVFKVLIYRYVDRQDILIGAPTNHTSDSPTIDLLVLRTNLSGNPTFGQVLDRIKQVVAEASAHQDLSFDRLIEALEIDRSPSYHPLVQVMFSLEQGNADMQSLAGLTDRFKIDWTPASSSSLDLALKLEQNAIGICGHFEYSTDLFNAATIDRMAIHFQTLIESIIANPEQSIDELTILTDSERQQLLVEWNQTQIDYPDLCIHQLFEAQVERTPDNIAIVFEQQQLTYRELNDRANQVAHYLQGRGVVPEMMVGLYVARSPLTMIGLLGILKTGAAYVPLDPNHPRDRIEYVVENAQIAIVLTQQWLIAQLPIQSPVELICLDTDWAKIATQPTSTSTVHVSPDQIAYLVYTSGSTGKPKGVEARHRGVVNFITSMQRQPGMTATDILLSVTTLSFDMAVLEIYLPITVGAQLVLVSREEAMNGKKLAATIAQLGITIMQATPATWGVLLESGWQGQPNLKILTGAEPISTDLVTQLLTKGCSVWNLYGPTETTVWSTAYQVQGHEQRIPIGKPIANTEIYILDALLQPVPIGVTGELYIGGAGLARGYWQKPDLTAEKFIPHPFSTDSTARIYQTGDLARYLPTGAIECLGRSDFQVKLRGFRIELGGIEAVLCQHPQVDRAVATVREDSPGDRRLVAYIITDAPGERLYQRQSDPFAGSGSEVFDSQFTPPTVSQLREFLAGKLPSYMMPSAFVFLDTLPLTPNGKIDRRALPAPSNIRQLDALLVTSDDELELQLTKMWEQVLKIQPIGIKDNFFDLGGHSLLAVKLIAKIEQVWHQKLPLATFLNAPTIAQFAAILRQRQGSTAWSSLVPIESRGSKPPLFCIHPVGGNVLEYYPLAHQLGLEQSIYGIQSQGLDGVQAPLTQIEAMAANYIKDIKTVQPDGPYLLVGYSFGGLIAFEIAHQLTSRGEKVNLLALLDTESPNLLNVRPSLFPTVNIHLQNFQQLTVREKIKYVKDRIVFRLMYQNKANSQKEFLLDHWPADLPPEYLNVLETNFQAGENYIGKFYPSKITLFRSSIQPITQALYPDLGWGGLADAVEVHDVRGHHSNLLKEPCIIDMARQLKLCIDRA
jgi:amino acid adenylation domain-containing protein